MSKYEIDLDDETLGPKALRDTLKKTLESNKDLQKRMAELEAKGRQSAVDSTIALRGLDPRVAQFYPSGRDTTATAVDEWIDENKDLFGVKETQGTLVPSTLSAVEREGYEIMSKIQAAEAATEMDFKSRLATAESPEDVLNMMRDFGAQHTF